VVCVISLTGCNPTMRVCSIVALCLLHGQFPMAFPGLHALLQPSCRTKHVVVRAETMPVGTTTKTEMYVLDAMRCGSRHNVAGDC
jgi:hypothetical protein